MLVRSLSQCKIQRTENEGPTSNVVICVKQNHQFKILAANFGENRTRLHKEKVIAQELPPQIFTIDTAISPSNFLNVDMSGSYDAKMEPLAQEGTNMKK